MENKIDDSLFESIHFAMATMLCLKCKRAFLSNKPRSFKLMTLMNNLEKPDKAYDKFDHLFLSNLVVYVTNINCILSTPNSFMSILVLQSS